VEDIYTIKRNRMSERMNNFAKRHGGIVEYIDDDITKFACCREHAFWLTQMQIDRDEWCTRCYVSAGEQAVEACLKRLGIEYYREYTFPESLVYVRPLRLDFYLPTMRLVIEFDGVSHYRKRTVNVHPAIAIVRFKDALTRDRIKDVWCRKNGMNLLRIPFWHSQRIEQMVEDIIHACSTLINNEIIHVDEMREWRVRSLNNLMKGLDALPLPDVATDAL